MSKGSAIIKFQKLEDSVSFLKSYPVIELRDSAAWLEFGFEHSNGDWTCKTCKSINFSHREICFKCSLPKSILELKTPLNNGRDDISIQPTRFLLIRNLDDESTSQKIFEQISLFESNLKRVWLLVNRETQKPSTFAFLEFLTTRDAEYFLNRQANIGVPLKINSKETLLSFGRDLSLLSQSLSGSLNGKISYWDNKYEFFEYPVYVIHIPDIVVKNEDSSILGIPAKRSAVGAVPNLIQKGPTKKIQLQLKNWTANASINQQVKEVDKIQFIREESLNNPSVNKFLDLTFICCLLCDVKFSSESELLKHAQNSTEHSEKFEDYWRKSVINEKESEIYIDRAAERREAFGVNEEEVKKILNDKNDHRVSIDDGSLKASTLAVAIEAETIGEKLLKKMGWKKGTGLGKDSSGIIEPIKGKTSEQAGAGIGAANLISADDIHSKSYNDHVRGHRSKRYAE